MPRSTSGSRSGEHGERSSAELASTSARARGADELRLVGQSAGVLRADLAEAGRRRSSRATRSSRWPPAFPTTVNPIIQNGCVPVFVDVDLGDLPTSTRRQLEAALSPTHPRDHDGPHARQSVRPGRGARRSARRHDLWLDRGQLRRARLALQRPADRHVRRPRHAVSFYPPHHITMGEGGAVADGNSPLLKTHRRELPRLGPRLLVRAGQGQHLRQALRVAVGRAALRLRPQVHLHATSATT